MVFLQKVFQKQIQDSKWLLTSTGCTDTITHVLDTTHLLLSPKTEFVSIKLYLVHICPFPQYNRVLLFFISVFCSIRYIVEFGVMSKSRSLKCLNAEPKTKPCCIPQDATLQSNNALLFLGYNYLTSALST